MKALVVLSLILCACGSAGTHGFVIPSVGANDRESLATGAISTTRLVVRAQAELDLGHDAVGGAAERWVRWALTRAPEDPGALAVAARLAIAQGDRETARTLFELASLRAGHALDGERGKNLAAFAASELVAGRPARAEALVDELEGALPEVAKELRGERATLHGGIARAWIARGLREPARDQLVRANKLGAEVKDVALRVEALDKAALQEVHARAATSSAADWRALARWLARFGRPEDADWAVTQARDVNADDPDNDVLAGELAARTKQLERAHELFMHAAERGDEDTRARVVQASTDALLALGQRVAAQRLAIAAHAAHPGDAVLARLAVTLATDERGAPITELVSAITDAFLKARPDAWARAFDWVYGIEGRSAQAAVHLLEQARASGATIDGKPIPDAPQAARRLLGLLPERALRTALEDALAPIYRGVTDRAVSARAVRAVEAYVASSSASDPDRAAILWGLYRGLERRPVEELKLAVVQAWIAAAGPRVDASAEMVLGDAYLRLERPAEAAAAFERALAPDAKSDTLAAVFRAQDRWDEALRLYDRMHPSELDPDALPELVRHSDMRGDARHAEAIARVFIARVQTKEINAPRALAFADQLADGRRPALAAELFALVADTGDKSSRVYLGWLRASLRMGADDQADRVANRYLGERSKRDQRPFDELASVFADEGRLGRAIDLMQARLEASERLEPNLMGPLADLLRRSGRRAELPALIERFVATDARNPQRAYQAGAQRLVEAGLVADARTLLDHGLEVRPRDQTLLSAALAVALLADDGAAVTTLAKRLFDATSVGSAVDVYERVILDVQARGLADVALVIADDALGRVPGDARLLIARGKVQLFAGRPERAFADFAEAIARSASGPAALGPAGGTARDVLGQLEPMLDGAKLPELLAALEARALAQAPGRADVIIPYGRALIATGKVDEAEQVFTRFLADNDRGHALVADAWFDRGRWRSALDHWSKGLDQVSDADAPRVLGRIAFALAQIGEPERLDLFVRLYTQSLDGRRPALLPVADAFATVGRAADALAWLERADQETPSVDVAFALGKAYLARGDEARAMAAFERAITRRAGEALPNQSAAAFAANAMQPIIAVLLDQGMAKSARDLVARVDGRYGASPASRFLAARAAVADGDLGTALSDVLSTPLPTWKTNRDLVPSLRLLIEDLLAYGHGEAAMAVVEHALASGSERELLLTCLRVGARTGHPAEALAAARRLWVELPGVGAWQAAEAMVQAGLPEAAEPRVDEALSWTRGDANVLRLALAALGARGARSSEAVDGVIGEVRTLREDAVAKAILGLELHLLGGSETSADAAHATDAFAAFLPLVTVPTATPVVARTALVAAALADAHGGHRLQQLLATPVSAQVDRARALRVDADQLAQAALADAQLQVLDALAPAAGGDGALALDAIEVSLALGRDARPWIDRLPRVPDQPDMSARFEVERARRALLVERPDVVPSALAEPPSALSAAYRAATNDPVGFEKAVDGWLATSVDEEVDRQRAAELALGRVGLNERWGAAGLHGLGLDRSAADWSASRTTSELALALTWFARGDARARLSDLQLRFPGPFERPGLLVEAALWADDVAGLRALFEVPLGMTRSVRVSAAIDGLTSLGWFARPAPSAALLQLLEDLALELPAADPDRAELLVAVALAGPGGPSAALAQAEAARERAPRARRQALLLARAAARVAGQRERVDGLLAEAAALPRWQPLGDFDAPGITPLPAPTIRAPIEAAAADAALASGSAERAAALYQRAIVDLDGSDKAHAGAWLLARGDALARAGQRDPARHVYMDAARRGTSEPWARAARARLAALR